MEAHTLSQLKDLSQLLSDSERGYAEAAQYAKSKPVKELLQQISRGRASLITDIAAELMRAGSTPPEDGTLKGDLHRAWMDIRHALTGADDGSMLDECERGENYLTERYDTIVSDTALPVDLRKKLLQQRAQIQANLALITAEKAHAHH